MTKRKTIILVSILILIAVVVADFAFNFKYIYHRGYPFDRITGTYTITIEGEENNLQMDEYYDFDNSGKVRLASDTESFKIKGGEYGLYKIGFMINGNDLYKATDDKYFLNQDTFDLSFSYMNANWWNIADIDIKIDLVKEDKWCAVYKIEYTQLIENGGMETKNLTRKMYLDNIKEVSFGL